MTWALFFQIEVILLTIGLVIAFVITLHQSKKDDSFFKRVASIWAALTAWGESTDKKKQSVNENQALKQLIDDMTDAIKQNKKKEEKNDE